MGFEHEKGNENKKLSSVSDIGAWSMNFVSAVGIIMANKQLISSTGFAFGFPTTVNGLHFTLTTLVVMVSNAAGNSASNVVPLWELLWFSIVANISVTASNFSLMVNSVGFYQISKLSTILVICVMEWILHGKQYSREVKMAVAMVVVGVGVCTVTDVKVNGKGFLCASVAVLSTSLQQISIGSLQKKYSINSFELLSKTAPIQAISLVVAGPFIDYSLNSKFLLDYRMSSGAFFFVLLSCSLAVILNVSQYLCIGRFSALSFQIGSQMKTVCVLILGWLFFDSELTLKNILGMTLTVLGMIGYGWAKEVEVKLDSKTISLTEINPSEEEELLKQSLDEYDLVKDVESPVKDFKSAMKDVEYAVIDVDELEFITVTSIQY